MRVGVGKVAPDENTKIDAGAKATLVKTNLQPKYANTLASDAAKVYNGGVNALEVNHGALGTLSLGPLSSAEEVEFAENMSRMKGLEQLMEKRMDPAATFVCGSADEALQTMTSDEKRRLVAAGKPEGFARHWATTYFGVARGEFGKVDPYLGALLGRPLKTIGEVVSFDKSRPQ